VSITRLEGPGSEPSPGFGARYRSSLAALEQAQKTPRGVSLYSTWVNRPVGRRLASLADVLDLTPNHVTLVSAACSLTAVALLALVDPSRLLGLVVGGLLVLGFALDSADGQLARLHRSGSRSGEYLDHMLDCTLKSTLHAAVLISFYRSGERGLELLIPLGFSTVSVLLFFGGILVSKLRQQSPQPAGARPGERVGDVTSSVLLLPADHGVLCLSFLLWGSGELFLAVYALLFAVNAALTAVFAVVWMRELR
jgi:phosphatidylglycerophosphate synthase